MASNSKSIKMTSRSNLSITSDATDAHKPPLPPIVTFGRRTSLARYSWDDLDSENGSVDLMNYTVHIPETPDYQPGGTDPSISQKVEEQYVSSSLFTGGFNSVTRAHLMDKVIDSEQSSHSHMAEAKGSFCAIPGCDANVRIDQPGLDILPCDCDFKICRDYYEDAVKTGGRSNLSITSDATDAHKPPLPLTVTFGRRTSLARYSRDDLDCENGSVDFMNYTVHIPETPKNQPGGIDPSISQKVEEQYVSSSLFTGDFNGVTRAHLMDKVTDSEQSSHPQMAGAKGSFCAIPGCDANVRIDQRGLDILPCDCDFKICRDCYEDAVKTGGGICPGCKDPYKNTELDQVAIDGDAWAELVVGFPGLRPTPTPGLNSFDYMYFRKFY